MIITYHREKLINAIIYFATNTNHCGKTKLLKLLYFLDFRHFKLTGKSVTGQKYYAWEKGPVARKLFNELKGQMRPDMKAAIHDLPDEGFQKIRHKKRFDKQYFSKNEMKLLEDISYIYKDAKADDMVKCAHLKNDPWDQTIKQKGLFKELDYMLAIDNDMNSLSYKEAKERMEERIEMHGIFGVS